MVRRAERQRLDEGDAQREARLGIVGQALLRRADRSARRDRAGGAAPRRRWHGRRRGRPARRGRAPRVRARIRAAAPCAAPRRAGAARRGATAVPRRVGRGSAAPPERIERARAARLLGTRTAGPARSPAAARAGPSRRPSPPARRSGSRSPDGSRTSCRRGRGPARCRARRRPGCAPRTGSAPLRRRAPAWPAPRRARADCRASPRRRSSAPYSRVRLIASWTSIAAKGATITARIIASMLPRLSLPRKNRPKLASIEIAPAMVAVIVMTSVSRFFTCAARAPSPPPPRRGSSMASRPVVAATAAFCGLRPVAKALGCGRIDQIDARASAGRPAPRARWTMPKSCGQEAASTSLAPCMREHDPVGIPVGEEVHARGDEQGDDRAAGPPSV